MLKWSKKLARPECECITLSSINFSYFYKSYRHITYPSHMHLDWGSMDPEEGIRTIRYGSKADLGSV
jgi:hypothetical protein